MRCTCGRSAGLPVKLLAQHHGPEARPDRLVARMRCQGCGARPVQAELMNHPQLGAQGYVGTGTQQRRSIATR